MELVELCRFTLSAAVVISVTKRQILILHHLLAVRAEECCEHCWVVLGSEEDLCSTSQPALALESLAPDKRHEGDVVSEHIRDLSIRERRAGDGLGNEDQTCCLLSPSASGSSGSEGSWGCAVFASM